MTTIALTPKESEHINTCPRDNCARCKRINTNATKRENKQPRCPACGNVLRETYIRVQNTTNGRKSRRMINTGILYCYNPNDPLDRPEDGCNQVRGRSVARSK